MTFDIWHLTFDMIEGTDSSSTDAFDIILIFDNTD